MVDYHFSNNTCPKKCIPYVWTQIFRYKPWSPRNFYPHLIQWALQPRGPYATHPVPQVLFLDVDGVLHPVQVEFRFILSMGDVTIKNWDLIIRQLDLIMKFWADTYLTAHEYCFIQRF